MSGDHRPLPSRDGPFRNLSRFGFFILISFTPSERWPRANSVEQWRRFPLTPAAGRLAFLPTSQNEGRTRLRTLIMTYRRVPRLLLPFEQPHNALPYSRRAASLSHQAAYGYSVTFRISAYGLWPTGHPSGDFRQASLLIRHSPRYCYLFGAESSVLGCFMFTTKLVGAVFIHLRRVSTPATL